MASIDYICSAILTYICAWLIFGWLTFSFAQGAEFRPGLLRKRWAMNIGIGFVLVLLAGSSFLLFQVNSYLSIVPVVVFGLQFFLDRYVRNRKISTVVNRVLSKYFSEISSGASDFEALQETRKQFSVEVPGEYSLNDLVYFYLISRKIVPIDVASKMSREIEKLISMYRQSISSRIQ